MLHKFVGDRAFYKKLSKIMLPILVQFIITNFVSLLDNVMVGQVGTEPMSGVAIVNQLLFIFNLCIFAVTASAGIYTAQFYGKGDMEGVRETFRMKFWLSGIILAAALLILLSFEDTLIGLFIHQGEEDLDLAATLLHAKGYLRIMYFSLPPFALAQCYGGTLKETGNTLVPMRASIIALSINLVLNYILIFGKFGAPVMGVEGAAIATVISKFAECFVIIRYAHRHTEELHFIPGLYSTLKVPAELVKKILKMGFPLILNEFLWSSGMTFLNQCYSVRGLEVLSACNIASTVSNLFFCAFMAMGNSISIIVGQLLGAGEEEKAVDEDNKLLAFSVFISIVIGVLMVLLAPSIPNVYNTTAAVKSIAADMLIVCAAMMPFNAFSNACYFTLRCGGKTWITFVFDCLFIWVACVPAAFIISRFTAITIIPMYAIVHGLEGIKVVIGLIMLNKRAWVHNLVK